MKFMIGLVATGLTQATAEANCVDKTCTTHCDINVTNSCCAPNACQYDPVFSDTRCIPPAPLICGAPGSGGIPKTMTGFAADSVFGAATAAFDSDLDVPVIGSLHDTFESLPSNFSSCEVLVQVLASSVNPSDVTPSVGRSKKQKVVLGSDVAGVVVAVDDQNPCKRLKVGSRVWGDIGANAHLTGSGLKTKELGGYGQYAVALESQLGIMPDDMTFEQAGVLPKVALTSYKALVWFAGAPWSNLNENITVLVLGGSGGTGTTGIQLAKFFSASTIITTCGTSNLDYCKENGADQVIDYHTQNWWEVLADNSVQVVYDTVGEDGTAEYAMEKLAPGGYFVTIAGSLARDPKPGVKQASFINSDTNLGNLPEMDALSSIVANGSLTMPRIFATFGLDEVKQGFELSQQGHTVGKILVNVSLPAK